jgi:hypothetical protein
LTAAGGNSCARLYALTRSWSLYSSSHAELVGYVKRDTLNLKQPADKLTQWAFFRIFRHHLLDVAAGSTARADKRFCALRRRQRGPLQDICEGLISIQRQDLLAHIA